MNRNLVLKLVDLDSIEQQVYQRLSRQSSKLWIDRSTFPCVIPAITILDTPHEQLMQDGDMLLPPQSTAADVEILKKFYAISYQQQATLYFLGVWEAADTDEFVLTSSSFGLYEGCLKTNRRVMLHRLFVISPRLVVVLRVTALRDPQGPDYERFRSDCLTRLGNLNLVPPKPAYTHTPARSATCMHRVERSNLHRPLPCFQSSVSQWSLRSRW